MFTNMAIGINLGDDSSSDDFYPDPPQVVHVVLSRDSSEYIFASTSRSLAEAEKYRREKFEMMNGGKPSIYIKTTRLIH